MVVIVQQERGGGGGERSFLENGRGSLKESRTLFSSLWASLKPAVVQVGRNHLGTHCYVKKSALFLASRMIISVSYYPSPSRGKKNQIDEERKQLLDVLSRGRSYFHQRRPTASVA